MSRWEEAQLNALKDVKKISSGPVNVAGRFGHHVAAEHASPRRKRTVYHLQQDKGYRLTIDVAVDRLAAVQPLVSEVVARFRILNSLLAEGALQRGLAAIVHFDDGDKRYYAGNHAQAVEHYRQAVAAFPRFASALNNQGICQLKLNDKLGGRRSLQRAFDLFSEDPGIRANLAICHLTEAIDYAKEGKLDEAGRHAERGRTLAPDSENIKESLALVYHEIGFGYANKENYERAFTWLEKAVGLKTKASGEIAKNLAILCVNAAIVNYNKRNEAGARTWVQRALKYDPQNPKAKEVLDALQKKK
jgi:tetratricopeptide (TPR) repeat protein